MSFHRSWLNPLLEVRSSDRHGRGVFATARITRGTRVAVFGGDILLIDEINDLPDELQDFPMQIEERFVLGSRTGTEPEPADFFNHSCDPNCGFRGQIFLVAMRDIVAGEELTFDYAMVVSQSVGSEIVFELECSCGSPLCRRRITEADWRLPQLRQRYAGFFSHYLQERIDSAVDEAG